MQTVLDVMTHPPTCVRGDATVTAAAALMAKRQIGFLPVVDDELRLIGVVTDRDLVLRVLARGLDANTTTVGSVATLAPATVEPATALRDVEQTVEERRVRRLVVLQDGRVLGVVSQSDVARVSPRASAHLLT